MPGRAQQDETSSRFSDITVKRRAFSFAFIERSQGRLATQVKLKG
jgi:hypothetical protein